MKKNRQQKLQQQVDDWNKQHPVGTPVQLTQDVGGVIETKTTAPAMILSGHSAVIWLSGVSGCYALERVEVM